MLDCNIFAVSFKTALHKGASVVTMSCTQLIHLRRFTSKILLIDV